jgi:hypothetical protein
MGTEEGDNRRKNTFSRGGSSLCIEKTLRESTPKSTPNHLSFEIKIKSNNKKKRHHVASVEGARLQPCSFLQARMPLGVSLLSLQQAQPHHPYHHKTHPKKDLAWGYILKLP